MPGPPPPGFPELRRSAWRGDRAPAENGIIIWGTPVGTPVGTPAFVEAHARRRLDEEAQLLAHLPHLADLQCVWILLLYSAVPRANHLLHAVPPSLSAPYAPAHDDALRNCLSQLLQQQQSPLPPGSQAARVSSLPHRMGGAGLRSAARTASGAYWAAWTGALPMIREHSSRWGEAFLLSLESAANSAAPSLQEAVQAAAELDAAGYTDRPSWRAL